MKPLKVNFKKTEIRSRSLSGVKYKTIDEYIGSFPKETREILSEMRNIVRKAAPQAKEKIGYNMPAFEYNGILVYFAAYKKHLGFYPTSIATKIFADDLAPYKYSKGAIQFPLDRKLPKTLISKIVKLRVEENKKKLK
ncbi:DUF1801 domain-containing protein [Leptospira sp. 201903070]|uniref:DUF1801 domain-containing protein n=1 Tax=Leptospira ainlahdjerensis TaxID=2810033 RepID=A0ABS2UBD6_9LEPT|nr:DUF1801 domain-containing protein [Leptospira ainlahdjerensis]MBM9577679.1 DUF1801 domain-containing protein [Leptospira ainlahdjerensis]MBM9577741.1 DUF1801 domain-containing protein [Leptospira ainlahdjerensis]